MSPIFVRPVREQLEHDRLIRFLQLKYQRKFEALINVGEDRGTPVKIGTGTFFPDLVLIEGKKLAGVVEVESGESVNNLEVMAQWVHFAKAKVPFHLYVPVSGYDSARRLCEAYSVRVTEVWTYRPAAEGFDLVRMSHDAASVSGPGRTAVVVSRADTPPKAAATPNSAEVTKPAAAPKTQAASKTPVASKTQASSKTPVAPKAPAPKAGAPASHAKRPPVVKSAGQSKASKPAAKGVKATRAAAKPAKKPAKKAKPASRKR